MRSLFAPSDTSDQAPSDSRESTEEFRTFIDLSQTEEQFRQLQVVAIEVLRHVTRQLWANREQTRKLPDNTVVATHI